MGKCLIHSAFFVRWRPIAKAVQFLYIQCRYEMREVSMATTRLAKWGNSLALRIPKSLAEDAQLEEGDPVNVSVAGDGSLVVRTSRRRYNLKRLVSRITAKNRHEETDWGKPVGREIW